MSQLYPLKQCGQLWFKLIALSFNIIQVKQADKFDHSDKECNIETLMQMLIAGTTLKFYISA